MNIIFSSHTEPKDCMHADSKEDVFAACVRCLSSLCCQNHSEADDQYGDHLEILVIILRLDY